MSLLGALGDIHGDFPGARRVMERHPDVRFWLCVGDVADAEGRYEAMPVPLYWIKGNNENFAAIASGAFPANLHFLANARLLELEGLRILGLGGTLAPMWYDTPSAELPFPGSPRPAIARGGGAGRAPRAVRDDKRRHFVREEVEACKAQPAVDVFLTHEAPHPFKVGRIEAGKTPINEVLSAVKPRLHLFGHHHRFAELRPGGIRSVGLDLVSRSYLLIEAGTLEYELRS